VAGLGRASQDIVLSPDGTSAYVLTQPLTDSESDAIAELRRSPDGSLAGLPSPNGCIEETGGTNCATANAHGLMTGSVGVLAISPDGANVYVPMISPSGNSGDVAIFDRRSDGSLGQAAAPDACIEESGAGSECPTATMGLERPTAVAVAPDGRDIYVTFAGSAIHDGGVTPFTRALAPTCSSASVTVPLNTPRSIALDCTDANPSAISIRVQSGPDHGTVGAVDPATHTVLYTPARGFSGADSLTFAATNALGLSSITATLTINVSRPAAPALSHVSQSANRWSERRSHHHHGAFPTVGTSFRFTLSVAARVTLSFSRSVPGRRVGTRCVKPTHANQRRPRCSRSVLAGMLSIVGRAGANTVHFSGRVSGQRKLRLGRYMVRLTAINPTGPNSRPRSLTFTIVAPT
jgi:hypothetical protein